LDGFESLFAFNYISSFDDCNLLGSMEEVNFLKIIVCAFKKRQWLQNRLQIFESETLFDHLLL